MTKLEMLQQAQDELCDPTAEAVVAFFLQRHGVKLNPLMVPILRASLQEKQMLERFRQQASAIESSKEAKVGD